MSEQRTIEQKLIAPKRATAGRYGPVLWEYDGKIMELPEAAMRYEKARADYLFDALKRIELAYVPVKQELAYKIAVEVLRITSDGLSG
jgi:hypothetical protein